VFDIKDDSIAIYVFKRVKHWIGAYLRSFIVFLISLFLKGFKKEILL